jgi:peptide-methionine (S)-S-oxide reductase
MGNNIGKDNAKSNSKATTATAMSFEGENACFGAGCYWGTEHKFKTDFPKHFPGIGKITTGKVGFMGPASAITNPTYRQVCSGTTGHVEVYNLKYTGGNEAYEALTRFFFQFHDPTTLNRQGNDQGTQYSSVIYCYSEDQVNIAKKVIQDLQTKINSGELQGIYQGNLCLYSDK